MMTNVTLDDLATLLERYTDGEIHATAVSLQDHLAALEHAADPEEKKMLMEMVSDHSALLEHLLHEGGRAGEDYVNDGVFHAMN